MNNPNGLSTQYSFQTLAQELEDMEYHLKFLRESLELICKKEGIPIRCDRCKKVGYACGCEADKLKEAK